MANLSNINNKLIVTDGGNLLVNSTANLATYGGITIDNFSDPSIAMKTTGTSGWLWTQYITSSGTNNFSMGVNQSSPYWCVKAGAGMDSPHLVVNSSGDVGIGTITPSALLEIQTAGTSGSQDMQIFSRGASPNYEVLKISRSAGSTEFLANQNLTLSADYDNNHTSTDSNLIFKTDDVEKMRIDGSGNLTLKSASVVTLKAAPLGSTYGGGFNAITVTGTSSAPYTSTLGFSNYSVANAMVIEGANVGIGTVSPSQQLELGGIVSPALKFTSTGTNGGVIIFNVAGVDKGFFGSGYHLGTGSSNDTAIRGQADLVFLSGGNNQRMRINSSGDVGIGYTNPSYKFQVLSNKAVSLNIGCYVNSQGPSTTNTAFYADASQGTSNNWAFYAASGNSYFANGIRLGGNGSSNELDDYEEGTFTPVLTRSSGGAISATYTTQEGNYIKIGSIVYIQIFINISAIASQGSGYAILTGLPFSSLQFAYTQISNVSSNIFGSTNIQKSFTSSQSMYFGEASITNFPPIQTAYSVGLLRVCGTYRV